MATPKKPESKEEQQELLAGDDALVQTESTESTELPKDEAKEMSKTKIYSMASNDVVISKYKTRSKLDITGANKIEKAIIIKGGAGVAFSDAEKVKRKRDYVVTEVDAEDLKILEANPSFQRKVKAGFISVGKIPTQFKTDRSAQKTQKDSKLTITTGEVEQD